MDTAGSYQLLVIVTGKSGTFRGHIQICHHGIVPHLFTKCQKGRERLFGMRLRLKSRNYWRESASTLQKETPSFTFPDVSLTNYFCSSKGKLKFR